MFDLTHIHPMIVHFPIALLIVGFVSELTGIISKKKLFTDTAFILLLTGGVGVVAAFFSGKYAGEGLIEAGTLKQALETHEDAAELAVWLTATAVIFRIVLAVIKKYSGMLRWVAVLLFFAAVLAIARTGFYGGELVFKHAAGVTLELGQLQENSSTGSRYGSAISCKEAGQT